MRSTRESMERLSRLLPKLLVPTFAALCLGLGLAACGGGSRALDSGDWSQIRSVARHSEFASRTEEFTSVEQLQKESTLVIVGVPVATSKTDQSGQEFPLSFVNVEVRVERVLKGEKAPAVEVFAESPDKFRAGESYLLFLRPLDPGKSDAFAVTGYLAGMYEYVLQDPADESVAVYGRVDAESPDLPEALAVKDGTLRQVRSE